MRVLHVITGLAAGGAEQQLRQLLPRLPADCAVVTLTNPGIVAEAIARDGIRVVDLGMRGNRDLTALPRLVRLIRNGRYDIVHTHLYRATVYGRIAARLAGVRAVVSTEHSLGDDRIEGRRRSAGVRALYLATERLGTVTIAVSRTVARRLVDWGVPPERIAVIPNGIVAEQFRYDGPLRDRTRAAWGVRADTVVVGAVGRLESGKRVDVLIRALARIPRTVLVIVGDGSARSTLSRLAHAAGVADRVVFTGETADVRPLLCGMDVVASASPEETFGLAILEALACGLPAIQVTCPALDELAPEAAPRVVRVPSDVETFAEHLAAAVPAPTRREPPPAVHHYAIDRLAGDVATLYERALGQSASPPGPGNRHHAHPLEDRVL
jgi:glycosyltransferase involved in cell wall biosynthesis